MSDTSTVSRPGSTFDSDSPSEVVFYTFPKLIFAWPLLAIGYLFFPLAFIESALPALGWLYVMILVTVILTMGVDLDRNLSVFWLVVALALMLGGMFLDAKDIPVFDKVWGWLGATDVAYNKGLGLLISVLLTPPFLVMLFWSRVNDRWRMTHNEFEHYAMGRADDSLARGAKRVRSTYPDWLEFILLGAGTLIVYSATGRQELRRIPHVPLLFLVRKKINLLLESQQVTVNHDEALADQLEAEEEEGSQEDPHEGRREDGGGETGVAGDASDPL